MYASATIDQLFTKEQLKDALILKANNFSSVYLRNDGKGKFTLVPLVAQAQFSILNGMVSDDFDGDGNMDVLINGNDFGTEVSVGRYDALNGLLLKGDGKGNFTPQTILQSGIFIPGNGKALVKLRGNQGKYLLAGTQNRGALKVYELKRSLLTVPINNNEISADVNYKNGTVQKQEFYFGCSFLSQSGRFFNVDSNMQSVIIKDIKGGIRKVK